MPSLFAFHQRIVNLVIKKIPAGTRHYSSLPEEEAVMWRQTRSCGAKPGTHVFLSMDVQIIRKNFADQHSL